MGTVAFRNCLIFFVLPLAGALSGVAHGAAPETPSPLGAEARRMDARAGRADPGVVVERLSADFVGFAGSRENAEALLTGLRSGTPITLPSVSPTEGGSTATLVTITPPTGPMGYGNAYVSLSLARAQLAAYGITQPTPEQLQAALTGGSFTVTTVGADGNPTLRTVTLTGVLAQRASGMGWGEIAKANGFKLGPVVSAMKTASHGLASPPVATGKGMATLPERGIRAGDHRAGGGRAPGHGITTAISGGGVVYGKSHGRAAQLASLEGPRGVSQGHGGGLAKGAGLTRAAGPAPGRSGSAPGHTKVR